MNDNKLKHLEFIQGVIARMGNNSFLIKSWMVTLVSALFALAAKDTDYRLVLVTFFTIPVFWLLDAFYLAKERQYRALYDDVRLDGETKFSMKTALYATGRNTWCKAVLSRTLLCLYVPMLFIATALAIILYVER